MWFNEFSHFPARATSMEDSVMKLLTVLVGLICAAPALAAPTLGVDFNETGSANQGGFSAFDRANIVYIADQSQTYPTLAGNVTVTIVAPYSGHFDRGASGFSN